MQQTRSLYKFLGVIYHPEDKPLAISLKKRADEINKQTNINVTSIRVTSSMELLSYGKCFSQSLKIHCPADKTNFFYLISMLYR